MEDRDPINSGYRSLAKNMEREGGKMGRAFLSKNHSSQRLTANETRHSSNSSHLLCKLLKEDKGGERGVGETRSGAYIE